MEYAFTANIEGVDCHIRAFRDMMVPDEQVQQRPHKHFFMEFHCIFDGQEQVVLPLQKKEYTLRPGQILMIPRETYHAVYTGDGFVKRLCFSFSAEAKGSEKGLIMDFFRILNETLIFENKNAMDMIAHYQSLDRSSPLFEQLQGTLLLGVVLELFSNIPGKQAENRHAGNRMLRQKWIIEDYIATAFAEQDGLAGLANRLFLSQRQTRHLVRQYLGEDYKTLIVRRRMELADIFLEDPEKRLEDIAREVGYSSYSGFNLAFKQYFGVTPRERRNALRYR